MVNDMNKMESFKKFVMNKPYLKDMVDKKEVTWQQLYEKYDLYGENDPIFQNHQNDPFSSFMEMINEIDVKKVTNGLNSMKKILGIISEVSANDEHGFSRKKMDVPPSRDDD
jgi:hypothetical protein